MPASGLYLHVPFCSAICPYCDFAVVRDRPGARAGYVEAVVAEAALWSETGSPEEDGGWRGGAFDTVYLGGGTPSLLDAGELGRVLAALRERLPLTPDRVPGARLFLEANPEDASPERLAGLRAAGVGTLSLGFQSFDAAALKFLGRRHTPDEARRAVAAALAAGFPTVSVDLIFGLPAERQGPDALRRTLDETVALRPHHVSCYQLTVHQGTPFARGVERGTIRELPEPDQGEAYELVLEVLTGAGYEPYEVSSFALRTPDGADHRSAHNRKYWSHAPYLGLGPSAHSFDGRRRWWNERDPAAWERRVRAGERPAAGEEVLSDRELALEAVMLGLRTREGIDLARFRERFGVDLPAANEALVERLAADGLVTLEGGRLAPTLRGFAVADGLAAGFEVGVVVEDG